jgi:hypothetical protein
MEGKIQAFRGRARAQAEQLIAAIELAETEIVATIERECEALRTGRMLAARALHTRLCDAARLYMSATKAARASLWTIEQVLPGSRARLDEGRADFAALLKVELSILAAERAAADEGICTPTMAAVEPQESIEPRRGAETGAARLRSASHLQEIERSAPRVVYR